MRADKKEKKNIQLFFTWTLLIILLGYGLLPVTIPDNTDNYDQPNTLLISRQECGCPCAEGLIKKGQLYFSANMKKLHPELNKNGKEITLLNFPPYDDITNEDHTTFDFANYNDFKITGEVVGVDTILCDPANCEVFPRFKVDCWSLTTYCPNFWRFNKAMTILYLVLMLFALPALSIYTFVWWRKKSKLDAGLNKQT